MAGWSCSPATAVRSTAPGAVAVRASRPWFAPEDRALADLNGKRYLLTLGERDPRRASRVRPPGVCRFIEAVHRAAGHRG